MRIEPEAREIILAVLQDRNLDSIKLDIINENGMDTIALDVGNAYGTDNVTIIDGVSVIASMETLSVLENAVFISDNGRLSVVEMRGCGCGCGCGGHDDGECGCGGHEHGEGSCCGGHEHGEGGCCGGHEHEHTHNHEGSGCCGCAHE